MRTLPTLLALWIATASAACAVDPVTFRSPPVAISGTITGLDGTGLVLTNNGGDDLVIAGNGAFAFATPVERGTSYALMVKRQPTDPEQLCAVANGTGIAGDRDVVDVQVSCSTTAFRVGGTVTGLAGSGLVLQNTAGDDLAVTADGTFTFATPVPSGATYDVTVATQPKMPSQTCTVTAGAGTVTNADVTTVAVTCTTDRYRIGGTLAGLAPGDSIVLRNSGGDDLGRSANGGFTFSTLVPSGQPYAVTIVASPTSPISQMCTVTNGTGLVGGGDVTDVQVACTTNAFTIGGTVSGLAGMGLVLQNNGGGDLAITASGAFTFATPIASGATYAVTVKTQPVGQTCTTVGVTGTGTVGASNVTSVQVTCVASNWSTSLFPITVPSGSFGVGDLALDNNGDLLVTNSNPARSLVRVSRTNGAQTTIAAGIGTSSFLLGVAYRAANDMIYTNTDDGQIFAVTPTGTVTPLATVPGSLNALAIAPPSFGGFGGFIIGVTQTGPVVAVNPANGVVTTITAAAGAASDLAFAPDGTLYISGGASVRTVTAAGVVTTFSSGLSSADGITITPDGARMFIADSGTGTVRQLAIPGGNLTTVGPAAINGGFFVGGILAAPGNTLIVMTGGNLTLIAFPY